MSGIIAEIRAFTAQKAALEVEARQMVALRLISGVDLSAALTAEPDRASRHNQARGETCRARKAKACAGIGLTT
jgi:hypothetical protein